MIKTTIEQVKLVNETLKKTPDSPPHAASQPVADMKATREANSKKLTDMFSQMNEHAAANRDREANQLKGQIKNFALKAPKGSIDIGHLGMMRENQLKAANPEAGYHPEYKMRPLRHSDMEEIINHHIGDAKSLKDIHQNHGGDNAIKTLMHTMGANGVPMAYSNLKFSKPGLHADLLDLVNPDKGTWDREVQRHLGVLPRAYFSKTPLDENLHSKVDEAYRAMMEQDDEGNMGYDDQAKTKALERAAVDRGLELFKRHHGLK